MALVLKDRVKEITTSTGTTAITLGGAATGFQSFNSAIGVGNTTYYTIAGQSSSEWEVGLGTLTGATTLARTTVLASSASGSPVSFSAGTKDVFVTFPAEGFAAPPAIGGITPAAITGTTVTVGTELDFPTVTPGNAGTGVIKMVDDGAGSGYDVLEIYSDDSGSPYTVRFPGGIQGAPMYLLSPDYLTNYHYINLTTPSGMTVDYTLQFPPTAGSANQYLKTDGTGVLSWATVSGTGTVTTSGSPTTNYLSKFTGSTVIGNSLVYDNGTSVGIGTASPSAAYKLDILGELQAGGSGKIATNPTWNGFSTPLKITIPNYTTNWGMVIQNATYGGNSGLEIGVWDNGYANIGVTNSAGVTYNAVQIVPGGNIFLSGTMNFGAAGTDTITLVGQVSANSSVGSSGQVLASRGANQSPQWVTPAVTTSGVFTNISSSTAPTLTVPALALTGTPNSSTSAKTGVLGIGPNFTATDKNILASFVQNINDYTQIITQNINAGTTASADFIVNNDSTTGAGTYGDFGINSSGFTGTGSFSAPNSVYLYSQGGDLVVGTQSANIVRFVVGSSTASDAGTITSTGLNAFPIGATTASTGAFTTLSASSTVSGTGFSTYLASPPAIGGTTAAAGTFTTLVANTSIGAGVASPSAILHLKAGTATASTAPLKFNSGTKLTTPEAGAMEYDGALAYFTPTGTARALLPNPYYYRKNTSTTITNATGNQSVLGLTNGVTLAANTIYEVDGEFQFISTGTTSHTESFGFVLTTATLSNMGISVDRWISTNTAATGRMALFLTAVAPTAITAAITTAQTATYRVRGTIAVSTGGQCNPVIALSATPGATSTITAGAWFRFTPIGTSGSNVSIGTWS